MFILIWIKNFGKFNYMDLLSLSLSDKVSFSQHFLYLKSRSINQKKSLRYFANFRLKQIKLKFYKKFAVYAKL